MRHLLTRRLRRCLRLCHLQQQSQHDGGGPPRFHSCQAGQEEPQRVGVYVHFPFCRKRCSYCNFNKYIKESLDDDLLDSLSAGLATEASTMLNYSADAAGKKKVGSVFFGGGTPSLMRPKDVERVLTAVQPFCGEAVEVSLEANPSDVDADRLRRLRAAGVTRLSLGVQSFRDARLRALNRDHDAAAAARAVAAAVDVFDGGRAVSADVIFGLPGQTLAEWRGELEKLLGFGLGHVSLYQLTLERGTPLWREATRPGAAVALPEEDLMADMYETAVDRLERAGLHRYEVSNFASSRSSRSRHNLGYWSGAEYVGVGPGAHSRIRCGNPGRGGNANVARRACDVIMDGDVEDGDPSLAELESCVRQSRVQTLEPEFWLREVRLAGHATRRVRPVANGDFLAELLAGALRTEQGLTSSLWSARLRECPGMETSSIELADLVNSNEKCRSLVSAGLLELDASGLRLTRGGMSLADSVLPHLLNSLQDVLAGADRGRKLRSNGTAE